MPGKNPDMNALFSRWFVEPINALKKIPNDDGALLALAVSCFIYERYTDAVLQVSGHPSDEKSRVGQFAKDFQVSTNLANTFWDVIRHGLLHKAMPKQLNRGKKVTDYNISTSYSNHIGLVDGELRIQPWLFVDKVLALWKKRITLLDKNKSFPMATIFFQRGSFSTGSPR
jgi:hypothetical protein